MKDFSRNIQHYTPLIGILAAGIFGFIYFSFDKIYQVAVSIAVSLSYISWGLVHHYIHRDLTLAVIVEYLAIATLGLTIVFSLVFRF